jgi:hypothetical protein
MEQLASVIRWRFLVYRISKHESFILWNWRACVDNVFLACVKTEVKTRKRGRW